MVTFYVNDMDEFIDMVNNKSLDLSKAFVETVLNNLEGTKRHIHSIDVYVKNEDRILEITIDRKDFLDTLEKNLKIHEMYEEYEQCSRIQEAIQLLKNNQK